MDGRGGAGTSGLAGARGVLVRREGKSCANKMSREEGCEYGERESCANKKSREEGCKYGDRESCANKKRGANTERGRVVRIRKGKGNVNRERGEERCE